MKRPTMFINVGCATSHALGRMIFRMVHLYTGSLSVPALDPCHSSFLSMFMPQSNVPLRHLDNSGFTVVVGAARNRRDWSPSSGALHSFPSMHTNTNTNAPDVASSRSNGRNSRGEEEGLSVRRRREDASSQRGQR